MPASPKSDIHGIQADDDANNLKPLRPFKKDCSMSYINTSADNDHMPLQLPSSKMGSESLFLVTCYIFV